ncbi:class I SAM-dependent methyltransferase [Patescibacteria group bacterium]|nr:class I SAM-dependent methyltransferase [Patescibacteria group bacterium]MBU1931391.1 class I SAM-dependent methyltransferase [Patescibacteria group bacterium]
MKQSSRSIKIWGANTVRVTPRHFGALRLKYALEALVNIQGRVLEIGCGAGAFTRAIKHYRPDLEILGTDINPDVIKLAQKKDRKNVYQKADVEQLSFKANSFDAVLAFDVIEHLKNPQLAFSEIFRVLKPGGRLHVSIPLEANFLTLHGLGLRLGFKPKQVYADHCQQFCLNDIVGLLKKAGFNSITWCYSGYFFFQLMDFIYFSWLSLIKKSTHHTVEGYVATASPGLLKSLLSGLAAVLALISYFESYLLKKLPGQIGHFSAEKK